MEPTLDDALLTAYLDGELTPQVRERLEQRLADEPELRQHLTALEETWHFLDLLEQENVAPEQIEATLKVTAISLSGIPLMPPGISRFCKWGIALLAGILLFVVPFNLGKQSDVDDPSFRRMVERLEMYLYRDVTDDGLEILRLLAEKRVFLPPLPEGTPQIMPHEYKPNSFSGWMPGNVVSRAINFRNGAYDAELHQLFHKNYQKYRLLTKEKVEQIRKMHRDIERARRSVDLTLTLENYYHWLKSLQSYERNDLSNSKTSEEKVANIIKLKDRLDRHLPEDAPSMASELIGIEESKRLAETLAKLPSWQQERLLNEEPHQIINDLKQSSL